jgi:hypothetical protein
VSLSFRTVFLVLSVLIGSCSDTLVDTVSTGSLSGSVTGPQGQAVAGALVVVAADDGSIDPASSSGTVVTDASGMFRVEMISFNFSQRETTGEVSVSPPRVSGLADTVVTDVVLRTGPDDPNSALNVVLAEE